MYAHMPACPGQDLAGAPSSRSCVQCVRAPYRTAGGAQWVRDGSVEYDLDNEDEDWLAVYNSNGHVKLSSDKFEKMLFKLEVACSEANLRMLAEPGALTHAHAYTHACTRAPSFTRTCTHAHVRAAPCSWARLRA